LRPLWEDNPFTQRTEGVGNQVYYEKAREDKNKVTWESKLKKNFLKNRKKQTVNMPHHARSFSCMKIYLIY
jgi:hypothetical protein